MAIINLSIVEKNVSRNDDIITCLSVLVSKIVKKPRSAGFGDFCTSRSGLLGPPFSSMVGIMHYPFLICFMNILGTSLLAVHIPLIVFCFLIICKVVSERIYVTDRSLLYHLFVRVVVMESLMIFGGRKC